MSYIETHPLQHSTILRIYSEKDEIESSPEYQRNGGIWTPEKKQLLIDSILNNYDIPKIYFHQYTREDRNNSGKVYSIIDGKQRLETIWSFIDNEFKLSDDFEYQDDENIRLAGMSYNDIAQEYPKIKIKFDSFVLPIISVNTDDVDLIEDMFSRLNEAAPLNSAEKRNAFGGDMVKAIREVSNLGLFTQKVRFKNNRYQHYEVAARYLLIESSNYESSKLIDTKKVYLDAMAKKYKSDNLNLVNTFKQTVTNVIQSMETVFINQDNLLRTQGIMVVYYLLFKKALHENIKINRIDLQEFDERVKNNRRIAEGNYEDADFELLEYDRLSQYGTNDVSNIRERFRIISENLGI
ncbi:DUF262 domain-containing protein [Chryseobacterium sp. KCF3-3]|uniref:DUF262 domain-containing protein n=1 Tax=Chryseobacterium sp. KCF3-3 TaxID=3231511 RepID=UPI0038B39500